MNWNHKSMAEMVSEDIVDWVLKKYDGQFHQNKWLNYIEEYWDEYFSQNDEKMLDNFAPIRYDNNEDPIDY
jgi:hypothetical protein